MGSQNPLLNPLVVQNLFQYIRDPKDVRSVRLVCHLWNDLSLRLWRSMIATARIVHGTPTRALSPLEQHSKWNTTWTTDDFFRVFRNPRDPCLLVEAPFKRFIFKGLKFDPLDDDASSSFWTAIGPYATHVTFESCQFNGNHPDIFVNILVTKLTALQSLTLINCESIPGVLNDPYLIHDKKYRRNLKRNCALRTIKIVGSSPIRFFRLLLIAPYIESLILNENLINPGDYRFMPTLYHVAMEMKEDFSQDVFPLKRLDVMDALFFNILFLDSSRHWRRLNFPLEHLSLTITNKPSGGNVDDIKNILVPAIRQHAGTLKTLKIFRPPVDQPLLKSPFQFPMESLEELSLSGNITRSLDLLRKTPNLKALHVDPRSYNNLERMRKLFYPGYENIMVKKFAEKYRPFGGRGIFKVGDGEEILLEQMEHLHINLDINPSSVRIMRLIADWMPNLTSLEAILTIAGFRAVCRELPNLEALVVLHGSQVNDEALTATIESPREPANITALRRLRKFHLKQLCDTKKYRLGDKSVYEGFLKMATLKSVHICVSEEMTRLAELDLKLHVPDVNLTRIHPPMSREWECCKLQAFKKMIDI